MQHSFLITGAILMAIAVMAGAFGAHMLQEVLDDPQLQIYQTAVQYQVYHSLGLLIVGIIFLSYPDSIWLAWSGRMMIAGILIFSGSLYLLVISGTGWLGAITPLGGLAFIAAWILLAIAVFRDIPAGG